MHLLAAPTARSTEQPCGLGHVLYLLNTQEQQWQSREAKTVLSLMVLQHPKASEHQPCSLQTGSEHTDRPSALLRVSKMSETSQQTIVASGYFQ